jgi:EAL domain-containing protein (putative c-di-GMP-specific phosphodiesterase class I)
MAPALSSSLRLNNDLHRAVIRSELESFFQPQVHARDGSVTGFEALMRWRHPEFGLIPPARFIPLAEDNGQIVRIGAWMLTQSCLQAQQCQALRPADGPALRVAVNLSARQFADPALMEHVREALDVSGLSPELLELEITEGTAMHDLQRTLDLLRRFKGMGLMLAIDDFGTGYSSLAYLKRFPVHRLKIDRSFVMHLPDDESDMAITNAVINMGHALKLKVIAEGVETERQRVFLAEAGCDEFQGYLRSPALPPQEFEVFLKLTAAAQAAAP